MMRRFGKRHWFLLEMPWHGDGVHPMESPIQLHIFESIGERNAGAARLRKLGRLTVEAGSHEARSYMLHAIKAAEPEMYAHTSWKIINMPLLIDTFRDVCEGRAHLF